MTGTDPLFGAALGSICFLAAFNRCPMSAVLLGCEIFGWSMFPFLAVGVAIAFLFGYPVGMYGASIDVLARSGWHRFFSNIRASVASMFPFLAVGVAIAFLFGYPVGMYGASIDVLARSGWHRFFSNIRASVASNEVHDDAGFTDFVMAAGSALQHVAGSAMMIAAQSEAIREQRRRHRHQDKDEHSAEHKIR